MQENKPMKPVVWYDENGTAHFDGNAAEALRINEEREWYAALKDLQRMGVEQTGDPKTPTPRDIIYPPQKGMGDMPTPVQSPGENYFRRFLTPRARPGQDVPIGVPTQMPLPPGAEQYRGIVEAFANSVMAASENIKRGPVYAQPMTWLTPPVTAIAVDVFTTAAGVVLPVWYPGSPFCVEVISIDVPDRWIFILDRFGNELDDYSAFGDVRFSMQRNRTPLRSYGEFDVQLGRFVNPTKFGSPIILKSKDEFRLRAQVLGAVQHTAYARIMGWAFAVRTTSGSGDYSEFFVQ